MFWTANPPPENYTLKTRGRTRALLTLLVRLPSMATMKPTPHASFSSCGSYRPSCSGPFHGSRGAASVGCCCGWAMVVVASVRACVVDGNRADRMLAGSRNVHYRGLHAVHWPDGRTVCVRTPHVASVSPCAWRARARALRRDWDTCSSGTPAAGQINRRRPGSGASGNDRTAPGKSVKTGRRHGRSTTLRLGVRTLVQRRKKKYDLTPKPDGNEK